VGRAWAEGVGSCLTSSTEHVQEILDVVRSAARLKLVAKPSLYREGVEVVLFLQSYRLKLGTTPIAFGVCVGLVLTTVVGVFTFWLRRRLPYRKMLVVTGVLLGAVLLVMAGEQAQEMQAAR
jgi:high-affinity iron transporter